MTLTGLDQLWVADITYIRLLAEFVYLAVILDAFSRRVIGWALGRTLEDTLTLRALRMALDQRRARAGAGASLRPRRAICFRRLHRSAPGARHPHQHVAQRQSLRQRQARIVHENAEVRRGLSRRNIAIWPRRTLASGVSWKRSTTKSGCTRRSVIVRPPSSSRGAGRPSRSGEAARNRFGKSGVGMSFFRHEEIYRPMDSRNVPGRPWHDRPRPHRYDEFPAGYSSAGCAPAEPASASPAEAHLAGIGSGSTIELQRTARSLLTACLTQGDNPNAEATYDEEISHRHRTNRQRLLQLFT